MPSALLLPVITCAAVLLVSGIAKLRDPASVDRAFTSLGVPSALDSPAVRRVVPWAEVALGCWLVLATGPALVVVAVLTVALFTVYLVLVRSAVRRPEPVDCGCFGALGDDRVTRVTVWRNGLLVLAALLAVLAGLLGLGVLGMLGEASAWVWLAMTALTVAVAVLVTHRSASRAAAGPGAPGASGAPELDENGEYVRRDTPLAAFLDEKGELFPLHRETIHAAHLLVFVSPGCGSCHRVAPLVTGWAQELAPTLRVRAVVVGTREQRDAFLPELSGQAWFDPYSVASRAFGVVTPGAVLVGTDGMLAGGPAAGEDDVIDFVAEVREHLRGAVVEVSDAP